MFTNSIFVRTVGLSRDNCIKLANDIKEWVGYANVYIQNNPCRIIVCYTGFCTVIKEGDVFSFMQEDSPRNKKHYIRNHSEKLDTVYVEINSHGFIIETYKFEDSYKFRLTDLDKPGLSESFNTYAEVQNRLNEFLQEAVQRRLYV